MATVKHKKKIYKLTIVFIILDLLALGGYFITYGPINYVRNLVITTAMQTRSHQWIAYIFYGDKTITNVMSAANDLPKAFGKIPVAALAIGGLVVNAIKGVLSLIIVHIRTLLSEINLSAISSLSSLITESGKIGDEAG